MLEDESWPDLAIAPPLKRARTDEHDDAGCESGWLVRDGWAAFYDLRSGLHRRFLEQISNRPNRHCGDIRDGGRCRKKNAKDVRTHTTCMDYITVKARPQRVGWLGRVLRLADRAPQKVPRSSANRPTGH